MMIVQSFQNFSERMCLVLIFLASISSSASAEEPSALRGRINDAEGGAVSGARVFLYDSPRVQRQASYISAGTDRDGAFRIVLNPGKYWAVARLKKIEGYGPLTTGDKHSGEPVEIEVAPGQEVVRDFTVVDLKDARKIRSKDRETTVKISGRIIDEKGQPAAKTYALAQKDRNAGRIPDYVSAWVDSDGRYTLYLPRGRYFLGSATVFPPGEIDFMTRVLSIETDMPDVTIRRKSGN